MNAWDEELAVATQAAEDARRRLQDAAPAPDAPKGLRRLSEGFPRPSSEAPGAFRLLCSKCVAGGNPNPKEAEKYRARIPELDLAMQRGEIHDYPVRIIQLGTCREHTDAFFSENWDARMVAARQVGDQLAIDKLQRELQGWRKRGRHFYGKEG
jgi:hypothetical protein